MTAYELQAAREDEEDRLVRLRPYIVSSRFALTEDDVRHDYQTGRDRYLPFDKQGETEPYDVQADWEERA